MKNVKNVDLTPEVRTQILKIAARHGVRTIRVFGSVARGTAHSDSDIDFLIDVGETTTPWFPGGLVYDLEQLLKQRVDVVEPDALREPMRQRVLREATPV